MRKVKCPVCLDKMEGECRELNSALHASTFECDACGRFNVSGTVLQDNGNFRGEALSPLERAVLSHTLRIAQSGEEVPFISSDWLREFRKQPRLPTPPELARRLIEHVGKHMLSTGLPLDKLTPQACARIGFFDRRNADKIFREIQARGFVSGDLIAGSDEFDYPEDLELTLKGWDEFESLSGGRRPGKYAFLALKFGDEVLDRFVTNILKPCIRDHVGYEVVDMRDVPRAGIIDNLMREQIRDAAFVIVDLTHDNSGAYWEAGYAEGLGKPVIYICEETKFNEAKTHFDTNHCTTVTWSDGKTEPFSASMIATVRRSLGLFPTK